MGGPRGRIREAEALADLVRRQGFLVRRTRNGYIAYAHKVESGTVRWHRTQSDYRSMKNTIADLRRIGVKV